MGVSVTAIAFENPFDAPGRWWKGNLHTHTTVSDGPLSPEATARRYKKLGYDFLGITDHVKVCEPFKAPEGLLVVPGAEYHTFGFNPRRMWHLVCLGVKGLVTGVEGPLRELHASVRENCAFYWAAHPNWSNISEDDLMELEGLPAVEVFNGVCERIIGRGYADQAWDYALAAGRRLNGVCVDDSHAEEDFGRGWIMLRARKLDLDAIFDALRRGLYYSTGGPEIRDLTLDGSRLTVRCSPARTIKFMAKSFRGRCFGAPPGETLESAEYELQGGEIYLRVQVEDKLGRQAYTNPLYLPRATGAS
jgi:hypothetical protein